MRKVFIAAIFISVLLAGCSASPEASTTTTIEETPEPTTEQSKWDDSPFGTERVIVAINDTTNSSANFTYAASLALSYWNSHVDEYGKYDAHFILRPNATNPDVILQHAEQIECGNSDWSGCAPIPNETTSFSNLDNHYVKNGTVIVRVEDDPYDNWRIDRNSIVHEIGHILGQDHYDRPVWAMAPAGDGIKQPVRDVSNAPLSWRDANLKVFVNTTGLSNSQQSQVMNSTQEVLKYYNSGAEGYRPRQLNLKLVDSAYKADIVIQAGTNTTSGVDRWGRSVDRDENLEFFVRGVIYLETSDTDHSYAIIGRMMAYLTRPHAVPPEFAHVSAS